jgi:hypothetical protein
MTADQVKAWVFIESRGPEAAANDLAGMVAGQPRASVLRMLRSYVERAIRLRQALEAIAEGNHTEGQVRAIARRALSGEE